MEMISWNYRRTSSGNMGVVPPKDGFLQGLREITNDYGALLIFDEVMTGFRVGYNCAQGYFGVTPDLTCLGKVIGGGLPVGAFGGRKRLWTKLLQLEIFIKSEHYPGTH